MNWKSWPDLKHILAKLVRGILNRRLAIKRLNIKQPNTALCITCQGVYDTTVKKTHTCSSLILHELLFYSTFWLFLWITTGKSFVAFLRSHRIQCTVNYIQVSQYEQAVSSSFFMDGSSPLIASQAVNLKGFHASVNPRFEGNPRSFWKIPYILM